MPESLSLPSAGDGTAIIQLDQGCNNTLDCKQPAAWSKIINELFETCRLSHRSLESLARQSGPGTRLPMRSLDDGAKPATAGVDQPDRLGGDTGPVARKSGGDRLDWAFQLTSSGRSRRPLRFAPLPSEDSRHESEPPRLHPGHHRRHGLGLDPARVGRLRRDPTNQTAPGWPDRHRVVWQDRPDSLASGRADRRGRLALRRRLGDAQGGRRADRQPSGVEADAPDLQRLSRDAGREGS